MSEKTKSNHLEEAKQLLQKCRAAALATLEANGSPYVSHVEITVSDDSRIFLLLSGLAVHTRNALKNDRVSLLIVDPSADWIIATQRATFQGRLRRLENKPDEIRTLILEQHPDSQQFIDFRDFYFFELDIENVRYIKGFGEMSRLNWE